LNATGRRGTPIPPLPLWCAGEFRWADRNSSPKNNVYRNPDRDAGGDLFKETSRPRRAVCPALPGTKRLACHARGTKASGQCGCSKSWLRNDLLGVRPTCSTTGNPLWTGKVEARERKAHGPTSLPTLTNMGGAISAIDYMKSRLVEEATADVWAASKRARTIVVGRQTSGSRANKPSAVVTGDVGINGRGPAVRQNSPDQPSEMHGARQPRSSGRRKALADRTRPPRREVRQTSWSRRSQPPSGPVTNGRMGGTDCVGPRGNTAAAHRCRIRPVETRRRVDDLADAVEAVQQTVLGRRLSFLVGKARGLERPCPTVPNRSACAHAIAV